MTAPEFRPTTIYFLSRADELIRMATAPETEVGSAPYLFRAAELYGELARITGEYPNSVI